MKIFLRNNFSQCYMNYSQLIVPTIHWSWILSMPHMYTCTHKYIHTNIHIQTHACLSIYAHIYAYKYITISSFMSGYLYITYIYSHTSIASCVSAYIHTYMSIYNIHDFSTTYFFRFSYSWNLHILSNMEIWRIYKSGNSFWCQNNFV